MILGTSGSGVLNSGSAQPLPFRWFLKKANVWDDVPLLLIITPGPSCPGHTPGVSRGVRAVKGVKFPSALTGTASVPEQISAKGIRVRRPGCFMMNMGIEISDTTSDKRWVEKGWEKGGEV